MGQTHVRDHRGRAALGLHAADREPLRRGRRAPLRVRALGRHRRRFRLRPDLLRDLDDREQGLRLRDPAGEYPRRGQFSSYGLELREFTTSTPAITITTPTIPPRSCPLHGDAW